MSAPLEQLLPSVSSDMLDGLGVHSGVDFAQVVRAGDWIVRQIGRRNSSRAGVASLARGEVAPLAELEPMSA